jgi:hypothetical protein
LDYEKVEKNIKLKLTLVSILLGCVSSVHAHLIDLTPGGFHVGNPPQVWTDWWNNTRGGLLLFDTSNSGGIGSGLFTTTGIGTSTLTISWDLTDPERLGKFQWLLVLYETDNGEMENFFQVSHAQQRIGEATIVVDGIFTAFPSTAPYLAYGKFDAPETGATILLLAVGMGLMLFLKQFQLGKNQIR